MASGEITYRLKGEEASAVNAFLRLIEVQKRSRDETRRGKDDMKGFQDGVQSAVGHMGSLLGVSLSVGGAVSAIRSGIQQMQQDLADAVNTSREFQNEFVNLQFLGDHYKDPQFRKKVLGLSAQTGIAAPEMARGLYTLESMTGTLTPAQRADMTPALLNLRRTMNVPLDQLVPTFAKMRSIFPGLSGIEQSNITQYLLEKAAVASPQEISAYAPAMFVAGLTGQMDARTTAALGAFMTAKTGTTAQAAQGLTTIVNKLMLKDPDEAEAMTRLTWGGDGGDVEGRKQLLARAGVSEGDNALTRIRKLQALHARSPLTAQDFKYLVSEKGMRYAPAVFSDAAGMEAMISDFARETAAGKDIVGTKLSAAMATDPTLRSIQAGRVLQAERASGQILSDVEIRKNLREFLENQRINGDVSMAGAHWRRMGWGIREFFGGEMTPDEATSEVQSMLTERGLSPWRPGDPDELIRRRTDRGLQARNWNAAQEILGIRQPSAAADKLDRAAANLYSASQDMKDSAKGQVNRDAHVEGGR